MTLLDPKRGLSEGSLVAREGSWELSWMAPVSCSIIKEHRRLNYLVYYNNSILVKSCKQGNQATVGLLVALMLMESQSQHEPSNQHTEQHMIHCKKSSRGWVHDFIQWHMEVILCQSAKTGVS